MKVETTKLGGATMAKNQITVPNVLSAEIDKNTFLIFKSNNFK